MVRSVRSLFVFRYQNETVIENVHAHCLYRLKGRQIRWPYPLQASKWIRLIDPLLALPSRTQTQRRRSLVDLGKTAQGFEPTRI